MKKLIVLWCMVCAVLLSVKTFAADSDFPPRPDTAIFVHDFAGVLKPDQAKLMNDSLRAFSKRTTNQIMVISVKDLGDYDPKMYAAELGDRWGVGQKKLDNGVIILIKPKTNDSKGKFAICPGRGLGGILPDVTCKRIVEKKAIPHLKNNNNYDAALWAVLKDVMPACAAEFAPDQKKDDSSDSDGWLWMIGILGGFGGLIAWARHKAKQRLANETPEERAARLAEEEKSRQEAEKMRKLRGAATPTITGLMAKKAREMRKEQERRKQENAEKFGGGSFDGGGASSEW